MLTSTATHLSVRREAGQPQLFLRGVTDGEFGATSGPSTRSGRTPLFSWADLRDIVRTGNLQKLSRHPEDLKEYLAWIDAIQQSYGSVHAYLLAEKLTVDKLVHGARAASDGGSVSGPSDSVKCFHACFVPGSDCQVLVNDWPYSVPTDVTHYVVWSYLPILHPELVPACAYPGEVRELAWRVISKRGLCGVLSRRHALEMPCINDHLAHLPSLLPADIALQTQDTVAAAVRAATTHIVHFISAHWDLACCEAVFFANPPSLQSVPALAHFHVLVKQIT